MKTTGVRELKNNLSNYLRSVRKGESILVTHRNKEIAVISPVEGKGNGEVELTQLIRSGEASWMGGKPRGIKKRRSAAGAKSVSNAVIEDRR